MDSAVSPRATATALDAACAAELVYRRDGSAIEHSAEFIFKHALLRDVTYETVLLRDRQRLHALAAEWLSVHSGERRNEFLEQIAGHLQLAGRPSDAAELHVAAGWRAIDSGRSTSAKRAFEAALGSVGGGRGPAQRRRRSWRSVGPAARPATSTAPTG